METLEYTHIDKSTWGEGPWQKEPDKKQWADPNTNLPCLIVRNSNMGNLCGYVGVTKDHPYFGKEEDQMDLKVHGGVTFTDGCQPGPEEKTIRHKVDHGEDDNVWWIGFDCAHGLDAIPGIPPKYQMPHQTYRDFDYVENEVRSLAQQLLDIKP